MSIRRRGNGFLIATPCHLAVVGLLALSSASAEVSATFETLTIDGVLFSIDDAMVVEGKVEQLHPHLSSGQAVISASRINGRGNQDAIHFHLLQPDDRDALKGVREGDWLAVKGRWGQFVLKGSEPDVGFNVLSFAKIPSAPHRCADFSGRVCALSGEAVKGGVLRCGADSVRIDGLDEWPAKVLGKKMEVTGSLQRLGDGWQFQQARWAPMELADLAGQEVSLTGMLGSLNGMWWFEREGEEERICLTSAEGPVLTFDVERYHYTAARVTGRLLRQLRPSLEQISRKVDRDLVPQYVVRGAKVEHLVPPSGRDWLYHWIHGKPQPVRDGIPLLVAEEALVPGLLGDETKAGLCHLYNSTAIAFIQRDPSQKMTDFLAARMSDEGIDPILKLVYASVLAARDDERGRMLLRQAVADPEQPHFADALDCLFRFPFLPGTEGERKPKTAWVEDILLALIAQNQKKCVSPEGVFTNNKPDYLLTPADAVFYFSDAPRWLSLLPSSTRLRLAMTDYALQEIPSKGAEYRSMLQNQVVSALCEDSVPIAAETLRKFAGQREDTWESSLRAIALKCLKQSDPALLKTLGPRMAKFLYHPEFRQALNDKTAAALEKMARTWDAEKREEVNCLLIRRGPDPVGKMLALLDDASWGDKSGLIWEMKDFKDTRVIQPLLSFLGKVKDGALPKDDNLRTAGGIEGAISAIGEAGGDEALRALISLLRMDFGRAKADYMTNEGLWRIVAAKLIDMTGESFGTDADAWTKWLESRAK